MRNSLSVIPLQVNVDKTGENEEVWVTVQYRKLLSVIIGCIHRHPKSSLISLRNESFCVLDDFNDDFLSSNNKLKTIPSYTLPRYFDLIIIDIL